MFIHYDVYDTVVYFEYIPYIYTVLLLLILWLKIAQCSRFLKSTLYSSLKYLLSLLKMKWCNRTPIFKKHT